jgi:protease I
MADRALDGLRVAILAADGFEQVELTQPRKALRRAGALTEVVSLRPGKIQGINLLWPGRKETVDRLISDASPAHYDALLIPGGFINPDFLRQSEHALSFVREFDRSGKPIATLCHGPWVLVSAGLVRGRRLASWAGIKDDITNAGGIYVDQAVVKDGAWLSSRDPHDLVPFCEEIVAHFSPTMTAHEHAHASPVGRNTAAKVGAGVLALAAAGGVLGWRAFRSPAQD